MQSKKALKCRAHSALGAFLCSIPLCHCKVLCLLCYKNHPNSHLRNLYPLSNGVITESTTEFFRTINLDFDSLQTSLQHARDSVFENVARVLNDLKTEIDVHFKKQLSKMQIWGIKNKIQKYEDKYKHSHELLDGLNFVQILDSTMKNQFLEDPSGLEKEVSSIKKMFVAQQRKLQGLGKRVCEELHAQLSAFLSSPPNPKKGRTSQNRKSPNHAFKKKQNLQIEQNRAYFRKNSGKETDTDYEKKSFFKIFDLMSAVNHSESVSRMNNDEDLIPTLNLISDSKKSQNHFYSGQVSPQFPKAGSNRQQDSSQQNPNPSIKQFVINETKNIQGGSQRKVTELDSLMHAKQILRNSHPNPENRALESKKMYPMWELKTEKPNGGISPRQMDPNFTQIDELREEPQSSHLQEQLKSMRKVAKQSQQEREEDAKKGESAEAAMGEYGLASPVPGKK